MNQIRSSQFMILASCLVVLLVVSSCAKLTTSRYTHGGIRYTLHPDTRFVRVEKGKDGSLLYDSPELTVFSADGRLKVNGVDVGVVKEGDHVEVTDLQTVLVNGQRRGDNLTGSAENRHRIQQSKHEVAVE